MLLLLLLHDASNVIFCHITFGACNHSEHGKNYADPLPEPCCSIRSVTYPTPKGLSQITCIRIFKLSRDVLRRCICALGFLENLLNLRDLVCAYSSICEDLNKTDYTIGGVICSVYDLPCSTAMGTFELEADERIVMTTVELDAGREGFAARFA